MPDQFDPYRESLIVEKSTVWSDVHAELDSREKTRIADVLHADPEECAHLDYVRVHTGFCRQVTVTEDDLNRINENWS